MSNLYRKSMVFVAIFLLIGTSTILGTSKNTIKINGVEDVNETQKFAYAFCQKLIHSFHSPSSGIRDLSENRSGEETITDPQGDVYVFTIDSGEWNVTDEKPNIDIKNVTYAKSDGVKNTTLILTVYGQIEDRGDIDSLDLVYYSIYLYTSHDIYEIIYINQTCQLYYYSINTTVNITDFSVDGGSLTIHFDVLNASETYDEMIATTFDINFSGFNFTYYLDMAPDPPMYVDAGGPYAGKIGEDINFSGVAYFGIPPYTYEWDFGDGETSTGKNPTHSYETVGNYTVTFTVTDDNGAVANDTTLAIISEAEDPNLNAPIIFNESPVNGSTGIYRPPSELNVTIEDPDDNTMNVYIRWKNHTGEWVTLEIYTSVDNGTYNTTNLAGNDWIWGNTTYTWSVNVTDGTYWTNKTFTFTTGGSRYDVNSNDIVNFQDAGLVWIHRTSEVDYDGIYDVNQNGVVNFQDAGLTWVNRD